MQDFFIVWCGYFYDLKTSLAQNAPLLFTPSTFGTFVKGPEIIRRCDVCIGSLWVAAPEMLLQKEQIGERV